MKHKCSSCGHEDEVNPAKMLASIRTPKKEAAWRRNGENLRKMFANARKLAETKVVVIGRPQSFVDPEFAAQLKKDNPALPGIAPKGSFTKDDLKAMIAGKGPKLGVPEIDLQNEPHAPFDLNIEGEPHRVAQMGKGGLWLFYLSEGGNRPIRKLEPGELETLWEKRHV